MMKLSRLLRLSRISLPKTLSEGSAFHAYSSRSGFSTAGQSTTHTGSKEGIFVPYIVYKGKAALSVTPVLPTFTKLQSGLHVVNRQGSVMLRFIPAIGERKYDWEKKQIFALSPTEVGSVISMGSADSCEFFHDPSMKSINAGQVRKSLSIKAHATGGGYMISLTVVNNILKTRDNLNVPFTTAEFAVVKTACSYALPHILGWDQLTRKMSPLDGEGIASSASKVDRRLLETEWEK